MQLWQEWITDWEDEFCVTYWLTHAYLPPATSWLSIKGSLCGHGLSGFQSQVQNKQLLLTNYPVYEMVHYRKWTTEMQHKWSVTYVVQSQSCFNTQINVRCRFLACWRLQHLRTRKGVLKEAYGPSLQVYIDMTRFTNTSTASVFTSGTIATYTLEVWHRRKNWVDSNPRFCVLGKWHKGNC